MLMVLPKPPMDFKFLVAVESLISNRLHQMLFGSMFFFFVICVPLVLLNSSSGTDYRSDVKNIAKDIATPKEVGQGQYGSSRWLKKEEVSKYFKKRVITKKDVRFNQLLEAGLQDIQEVQKEKQLWKEKN